MSNGYGGRTVREAVKVGSENGATRAAERAERRQLSAGVPAAGPLTATDRTRPLGPNVTCAWEPSSWPARQLRAPIITEPTAA